MTYLSDSFALEYQRPLLRTRQLSRSVEVGLQMINSRMSFNGMTAYDDKVREANLGFSSTRSVAGVYEGDIHFSVLKGLTGLSGSDEYLSRPGSMPGYGVVDYGLAFSQHLLPAWQLKLDYKGSGPKTAALGVNLV